MGWLVKERRGPAWKQSWKDQTLASISPPPLPLLAFFGITILFLAISYHTHYKARMHDAGTNFSFVLFLLPVLLILVARNVSFGNRGLGFRMPDMLPNEYDSIHRAGGSPLGVAAVVVLLLIMVSYQHSFHSKWARPFWKSVY